MKIKEEGIKGVPCVKTKSYNLGRKIQFLRSYLLRNKWCGGGERKGKPSAKCVNSFNKGKRKKYEKRNTTWAKARAEGKKVPGDYFGEAEAKGKGGDLEKRDIFFAGGGKKETRKLSGATTEAQLS